MSSRWYRLACWDKYNKTYFAITHWRLFKLQKIIDLELWIKCVKFHIELCHNLQLCRRLSTAKVLLYAFDVCELSGPVGSGNIGGSLDMGSIPAWESRSGLWGSACSCPACFCMFVHSSRKLVGLERKKYVLEDFFKMGCHKIFMLHTFF